MQISITRLSDIKKFHIVCALVVLYKDNIHLNEYLIESFTNDWESSTFRG